MTSARRTPRYVAIIGAEPMMGPHLLTSPPEAPVAAPPSVAPRRGSSSGIIPLHAMPALPAAPVATVSDAPAVRRAPQPARKRVALDRRPWHVMIVPASPAAAPRRFDVARWQVRAALGALALVTLMAGGLVAAVVLAVRAPDLFVDGTEVQSLRAELQATRDSLAEARLAGAAPTVSQSGSPVDAAAPAPAVTTATSLPAPAASTPAPAHAETSPKPPVDRPKPLSARPSRRLPGDADGAPGALLSIPRSLADLPVIGAIASGFSRARRHPLLHLTRPHLGVDLAAPRGTRVSAPAPGRVSFVGRKLGFGLVVELDHGQGVKTRYAHLRSSAVEVGEQVTKGEAIAAVGTSGITTGPHLHYEVLIHGHQVDPLRYRFAGSPEPAPATVAGPATPATAPSAPAASGVGMHDSSGPGQPAPAPR